jgi:alpha-galactosidase
VNRRTDGPLLSRAFETVTELEVDVERSQVFELGWQSWSPSAWYGITERPLRPVSERNRLICYRPEVVAPENAFSGEGLLAVSLDPEGPTQIFGTSDVEGEVPSLRAELAPGTSRLVIAANGPVSQTRTSLPSEQALAAWADGLAGDGGVGPITEAPTLWSHWYHYFNDITASDIIENVDAMGELEVPVDVVEIDDGYQQGIGDWLEFTPGFANLTALLAEIRERGHRAGIWLAPWLVGERSRLFWRCRDWLVHGENGDPKRVAHNWGQDLFALDTTHPGAGAWLSQVLSTFADWGVDFFKLDFVFAGAVEGRRQAECTGVQAYRSGLRLVRDAVGEHAHLLGCGAPIIPSVGLVGSMRVSPDVGANYAPEGGDLSQPSQAAAVLTGRARAFMHGRFWVNDADCLIVDPMVERRAEWAEHVRRFTGLRSTSDRLRHLDQWGLDVTRELLQRPSPEHLVDVPELH